MVPHPGRDQVINRVFNKLKVDILGTFKKSCIFALQFIRAYPGGLNISY